MISAFVFLFFSPPHVEMTILAHSHTSRTAVFTEAQHMKIQGYIPQTASSKSVAICWENINCCGLGPGFAC